MKILSQILIVIILLMSNIIIAQIKQDSIEIKQVALDYIESQHKPNAT